VDGSEGGTEVQCNGVARQGRGSRRPGHQDSVAYQRGVNVVSSTGPRRWRHHSLGVVVLRSRWLSTRHRLAEKVA